MSKNKKTQYYTRLNMIKSQTQNPIQVGNNPTGKFKWSQKN